MQFRSAGYRVVAVFVAVLLMAGGSTAVAEVLELTNGGRLTGELVNRDELPRQRYVVETPDGARVTLDASQVRQVAPARPDESQYEKIRPTYPDTVEGQGELAQWCAEHHLTAQRETHLRRVIELDPNHAEARRILGYHQVDGQWETRDEVMTQRGYQRYKGRWRLQQEVEILENRRKAEEAQQEWFPKIKRWRLWLGTDHDQQARENIRNVDNPAAVKALKAALDKETSAPVRLLYFEALAKIDNLEAAKALANASIYEAEEETRLTCLDYLQTKPRPEVVAFYVSKLKERKNYYLIDRAGTALGRMKDPSAIAPLMDALVTAHKFKIPKPGGDNATSAGFTKGPGGTGSTGFTMGGGPKYEIRNIEHQSVLNALKTLTGQNFDFDKQSWKAWYATQRKVEIPNARRD